VEITPEVIAAFRRDMGGAFCVVSWPDELVKNHLCYADAETGGRGWGIYVDECGNFKARGTFLYAAHSLVSVWPGGIPGQNAGSTARNAVGSKSVGDESVSFAVPVPLNTGDSWLSSTGYGQQFLRLRRRAGMGAVAL